MNLITNRSHRANTNKAFWGRIPQKPANRTTLHVQQLSIRMMEQTGSLTQETK